MRFRAACALLATIAFAALPVPAAHAASSRRLAQAGGIHDRLALDLSLVEVRARPGTTVVDRVKIINKTAAEASVSSFVEDLGTDAQGDLVAVPRGTVDFSASAWVKVTPPTISVAGNGSAGVVIKIAVPKGTAPGGYYTSVTFDTESSGALDERLVHAILIRVEGAGVEPEAHFVSLSMPAFSASGRVRFRAVVENKSRVHAIGGGSIVLTDLFGKRVGRVTFPSIIVLRQSQRVVTVTFKNPPVIGRLKARATLDFGDGRREQAAASGYVVVWWLATGLIGVLLLFAVSLLRVAGVTGPKAAARHAERAASAPPQPMPSEAPSREGRRGRKRKEQEERQAAAAVAEAVIPPRPAGMPPRPAGPPPLTPGMPPRPAGPPPLTPGMPPRPAGPPPRPAGPPPLPTPPPASAPDASFWGPEADDEGPAPFARPDDDHEPVVPVGRSGPLPAGPSSVDVLDEDEEASTEVLPWLAVPGEPSDEEEAEGGEPGSEEDDVGEDEGEDDADGADDDGAPADDEPDDDQLDDGGLLLDDGEPEDDEISILEPEEPWPSAPPGSEKPPRRAPVRPVPVVGSRPPSRPVKGAPVPPPAPPAQPEIRPASRGRRPIEVASLPPVREPSPLPVGQWSQPPPELALNRPAGGSGSAIALRRSEVALRMITGKPGETGAILDAGLDLLYSVRSDPSVVGRVEQEYEQTRNRRRLGPLALALFAVDSRIAPEALLDAYATASKVVSDRIRRAILACDPADIRPHRALIAALSPARRDALGL